MATDLQAQIDDLRTRLTNLQSAMLLRALRSEVLTYQSSISTQLDTLTDDITDIESELQDLNSALLTAREELTTHSH